MASWSSACVVREIAGDVNELGEALVEFVVCEVEGHRSRRWGRCEVSRLRFEQRYPVL